MYDLGDSKGFSLFELLIALLILSTLSSLAYPVYSRYLIRAKRLEAHYALLDLSNRMEQYALENHGQYTGATLQILGIADRTERKEYQLQISDVEAFHYTAVATPTFQDASCARFMIDQRGDTTYEGTGTYAECWG